MKKESLKFSIHNLIIDAIVAGAGIRACTIARRRAVAVRKVLEMRAVAAEKSEFGLCGVVGGMTVIELLAGTMRRGRRRLVG